MYTLRGGVNFNMNILHYLRTLGIKSDFRCEVFKYAKICSEKYSHKAPPPPTPYSFKVVLSLKRKLSS